jgi:nucleoside 2-deoxyribosyltransferase|tara:strand:- start:20508 stop:21698 length:1191 start_codon:yes stop_codon:yes gene_type:complete
MTTIVGGVYVERCIEPPWDEVFGSAGRAAMALSDAVPDLRLLAFRPTAIQDGLENLEFITGASIEGPVVSDAIEFDYMHSLADPRITPRPDAIPQKGSIAAEDDVVLRFGMLEGEAKVTAKRAVYDPQSAFDPQPFHANGSSADELALVVNRFEGCKLTGKNDPEAIVSALLADHHADVVVLKMGGRGALVGWGNERKIIPAFRSEHVWKIGSGDVFSAAFLKFWALDHAPPDEAALLSSKAVSVYAATRSLPIPSKEQLEATGFVPVVPGRGRIYLAAPFFNLGEIWMVEEARKCLLDMNVEVFSPLHDVGRGPAHEVAKADLEGLDHCDAVLAILNGGDAGTIFEIGYAVSRNIPVVALAQNVRPEDLKMSEGSGCVIADDFVTAVYQAVWSLP